MVSQRRLRAGVQQDWKGIGRYSTVGLEFALSVIVGLMLGQWLDEKFDTGGLLTLVWFFFGLVAGGRAIYRAAKRAERDLSDEDAAARETKRKYLDDDHDR